MRQLKINQSITNRDSDGLEKYLSEISRVELITAEEEVLLAARIKNGDEYALNKLAKANLRFVVSVAKQYQNQGISLADLINEGNIGLLKACSKYDPSKGFKFISYAVWWIRQSILQALSDQSRLVRIPLNKINLNSKIRKAAAKLEQEFEREPTAEEIAKVIEADTNDVELVLRATGRHISMDAPLSQGEETDTIGEVLNINTGDNTDKKMDHSQSLSQELTRTLTSLPGRHKEILLSFYGIGNNDELTLEELGAKYGLTRERVRQIKDAALAKLRIQVNNKVLRSYLG